MAFRWLKTGDEAFAAMLAALAAAQKTVRLETYIFTDCDLGCQFREALIQACRRGVQVRVLIDAFGSVYLLDSFWQPLRDAGGECRWFNPLSLGRLGFRDHRKLMVCDEQEAFIGGFNIMPESQGDGLRQGWKDIGMQLDGPLAGQLALSFDHLYERADFRHQRLARWRSSWIRQYAPVKSPELLLSGPGRGFVSIKRKLSKDLERARSVKIMAAYFLPTWRLRRLLMRVARRGGKVQLILAGKSDVAMSQWACRRLYQKLLGAGVEIYEYAPQVLHAKLMLVDKVVYVGSANLDVRSLRINYELMLRLHDKALVAQGSRIFAEALQHSVRIEASTWRQYRSLWGKLKEMWAYFLLTRVDPYLSRRQLWRLS